MPVHLITSTCELVCKRPAHPVVRHGLGFCAPRSFFSARSLKNSGAAPASAGHSVIDQHFVH